MANQKEIRHGSRRKAYADEMEKLIEGGMPVSDAARKVGEDHGIAPGTAHAALYEWRRRREGRPPARRVRTDPAIPADLRELLAELAETQAFLNRQIQAIVDWAVTAEADIEKRALAMIRAAAKT